jgi:hypothetical protein
LNGKKEEGRDRERGRRKKSEREEKKCVHYHNLPSTTLCNFFGRDIAP